MKENEKYFYHQHQIKSFDSHKVLQNDINKIFFILSNRKIL
jgi:hypothetical protein